MEDFSILKEEFPIIREKMREFILDNPASYRYYSQKMKMTGQTFQRFLNNEITPHAFTVKKVIKFLRDQGIEWK